MPSAPPIIGSPSPRRIRLGRWPWVLAIVLILFYGLIAVSAVAVVGFFRVSSTTRELRNGLSKELHGHLDKQLEVRAGGMSFGLARLVMAFTDVEPEVRAALNGVRAAEVGIYRVESADTDDGVALEKAERGLIKDGWDRVVFVKDKNDAVAVYARPGEKAEELKVCAVVLSGDDLVVASVHSNLDELINEIIKGKHLKELKKEIGLEVKQATREQSKRRKKNEPK